MEDRMKKTLLMTLASVALLASYQAPAVNVFAEEASSEESQVAESSISVEGLAEHYHTGDEIQLVAQAEEGAQGSWQWYIRDNADADWTAVDGLTTQIFSREATKDGLQIKVALLEDNGDIIQESEVIEVHIDDHHTGDDENGARIYSGFFYNDEVADRTLADWEGDWQSVYPYLVSGDLDEVFEAKAEKSDSMTAEEYKEYYTTGYETDVDRIVIEGDQFTFYYNDGTEVSAPYEYDGYEVLTYERGNRGVRFVFKRSDDTADMPAFIQFSDHSINPTDSSHYHLYWGDDRDALLEEVDHWPTYYPSGLDTEGLVHDMLAH